MNPAGPTPSEEFGPAETCMSAQVRAPRDWARRVVVVRLPVLIAVAIGALVAGGLIGVNLPFGATPMTVSRGTAAFSHGDHLGTIQANRGGVSALIPGEVAWLDRSGHRESAPCPAAFVREGTRRWHRPLLHASCTTDAQTRTRRPLSP